MLQRLNPALFDFTLWRNGSIIDIIPLCRFNCIVDNGDKLREYAVGWCKGESLPCRPKLGEVAIMYYKDGKHFWSHLREEEFKLVFRETK